jgi:preprotein translocase subunit SecF
MRSINTSLISVIPVLSLMVVAVWLLGVGTLKDLALVMLVGILVGTYSSIFLATPLLVTLREQTALVRTHTRRVLNRRKPASTSGDAVSTSGEAADTSGEAANSSGEPVTAAAGNAPDKPAPGARPAQPGRPPRPSGKRSSRRR